MSRSNLFRTKSQRTLLLVGLAWGLLVGVVYALVLSTSFFVAIPAFMIGGAIIYPLAGAIFKRRGGRR